MELLKETYDYKDIKKIVGCCTEKAYKLISDCQHQFKIEFPNAILMNNRVPKWYFNARVLGMEERRVENEKQDNQLFL